MKRKTSFYTKYFLPVKNFLVKADSFASKWVEKIDKFLQKLRWVGIIFTAIIAYEHKETMKERDSYKHQYEQKIKDDSTKTKQSVINILDAFKAETKQSPENLLDAFK